MAQTTSLEAITISARKIQVNIQDASIAVSAISGKDFDRSNIGKLDNFNGYAPGLTIAKNDGAGRVVAIRGVGWETAQNLSTQPSVLVYMDGIYVANPLSIGIDLGEIERVDVYRGPQGTEFGQGTTGGAIDVILKKPSLEERTGDVQLAYGTYNMIKARGALNIPLSDNAAFRGSVQKYSHDGFAEIEGGALDGYDLDDADSITGTLAMLWKPSDSVSVSLSAFMQDSDQHAAAQKSVDDPNSDARKLTQDYPGIFKLENSIVSATVEWLLRPGMTFKSMTGYQRLEKRQTEDGDRLTEPLTDITVTGYGYPPPFPSAGALASWDVLSFWNNDSDAFSQEFNLLHHGDKLDWVLGAYYLDHKNTNFFLEATGASPFSDSVDELANPGPNTLPPFASVLNFVEDRTVTRMDKALYGQLTYQINDRYAVTAGGRYQHEDQKDESTQYWNCLGGQCPAVENLSDQKFTWKAGLDIDISDDHLLYALVSTASKNGGTNPGARPNSFTNPDGAEEVPFEFKPETVTSYEIGSKNTFLDDRFRFNLTGFYYDYKNLQFTQEDPDPFAGGTGNIPKSEIYGLEAEFGWLMNEDWRLDGYVAWMDGEVKSDFHALDVVDFREALEPFIFGLFTPGAADIRAAMSQNTNLKGNTPPKLVDLSARIGVANSHSFANGARLESGADWIYRGEYQYRVFNNPLVDNVPSYDIVNLFFNYVPANSAFDFALSATNLFDKNGVNARFSNPYGLLTTSEEYIPPREIIFSARYSF